MDYRDAGVDIEAGRAFVNTIRQLVERTHRPEVLGGLGGFGGCFQLPSGYREPVLISGTDGVGTKLKLAHALDRHDTVGIDLVAMCVNDILTSGAEPLFFLDYLATGALNSEQLSQVVAGISEGCTEAGCALLGGETAEMPGFYQPGEYDLAGFCVGIAEKSQILDGSRVEVGNAVIGLASSGVHSNGYSLARKIVSDGGWQWSDAPDGLGGKTLGDVLLSPTRIYVKPVLDAIRSDLDIRGMAHITGGGLPENLPRCLGDAQAIALDPSRWSVPPVFEWLSKAGNVQPAEMFKTFNMGIGFALIVPLEHADRAVQWFRDRQLAAFQMGEVVPGRAEVTGLPD